MSLMSLYTHLIVVDELKANLRIYIHTTGYNTGMNKEVKSTKNTQR